LRWASNLVAMVQVSLVGYLVGGAFLNLAYWDLPYFGLAILIITGDIVRRAAAAPAGEATPAAERAPPDGALRPAPGPAGPSAVSRDRLDSKP
jgi:hypothetical protein